MPKIAIIGTSGMLGSNLATVLASEFGQIVEINRRNVKVNSNSSFMPLALESKSSLEEQLGTLKVDFIINAVGKIKQVIDESSQDSIEETKRINTTFPIELDNFAKLIGAKSIQIGTDCVFSGTKGGYSENSFKDATDLYGISKINGEESLKNTMTIRTSIVGLEVSGNHSLLSWFLNQPRNSQINGYTNHYWNGITTLAFSKIVNGIIESESFSPGILHLVPKDSVSKYTLLSEFAKAFNRKDIEISAYEALTSIDRTLTTLDFERNQMLWKNGGYSSIPTIKNLVEEFAEFSSIFKIEVK